MSKYIDPSIDSSCEPVPGAFIPNWLMRRKKTEVAPKAKCIYGVLTQKAWGKGCAKMNITELAESTGDSVRNAQQYIYELRDLGLLEAIRQKNGDHKFFFLKHPWIE